MIRVIPQLLVAALAVTGVHAQSFGSASRANPEIAVNGTGSVRVRSDRASVTVSVVTRATSAAVAGRQNALQFQPVMGALKRLGLPDSALTTTGYSVTLETDPYGRAPATPASARQYIARNAIGVALANLELLGQVLDTALAAGATEITNIAFSSSQAAASRERAIALAVRAAHTDASAIAAATGGTLGPIIEVTLLDDYGMAYGMSVAVDSGNTGSAGTSLRARDITVAVRVRVRYAFIPPT